MSRDDKNLLAFVAGLFIAAALLLPGAVWATTLTPTVQGFARNSVTGGYLNNRAGNGQSLFDAAARKYGSTGVANIGSKSIAIPAKMAIKANAGNAVKLAMRLNPALLAGTLAAGWLYDHYMTPDPTAEGGYTVATSGDWWSVPGFVDPVSSGPAAAAQACTQDQGTVITYNPLPQGSYGGESVHCQGGPAWNNAQFWRTVYKNQGTPSTRPATEADWDALPDPIDAIGQELPTAPYMPDGVEVDTPEYDFAPYDIPTGSPYQKPDGSTWQDGVTVSKSWSSVTNNYTDIKIVNNSTQITNPDGSPVADPVAEEAPAEEQDQCQKYPDSAACQSLGTFSHAIPKKEHVFEFSPEAVNMSGSCPADIQILGSALSFAPACGAMSTIKPIVVGMAAVVAAMILFGGMRGAD